MLAYVALAFAIAAFLSTMRSLRSPGWTPVAIVLVIVTILLIIRVVREGDAPTPSPTRPGVKVIASAVLN